MSPSTLALRWALEEQGATATIAGTRNPVHVHSNARAGEVRLSAEAIADIDAIVADA
jgi:aryl-alcohol dehydrogenase-like predicted oxidoreductase